MKKIIKDKMENIDDWIDNYTPKVKEGESEVTLHTLEKGYFITICDLLSKQLMALTEAELVSLYKLLMKKYEKD